MGTQSLISPSIILGRFFSGFRGCAPVFQDAGGCMASPRLLLPLQQVAHCFTPPQVTASQTEDPTGIISGSYFITATTFFPGIQGIG